MIKVRKTGLWYHVFFNGSLVYEAVAMQAVLDWLDDSFAPPIKVQWIVKHKHTNMVSH